jgi:hypothetical protein
MGAASTRWRVLDMGDVNSLLANPSVPDFAGGIASIANTGNVLNRLQQSQQEQAAMQAAGQALASGDHDAAANVLMKAGKINEANAIKQQGAQIKASQLAGAGDYDAAAQHLLQNGYYDQARKMQSDHLSDVNQIYEKIGNLALANPTPDQWNSTIQLLESHGTKVPEPFHDPVNGPKLAVAYANKVKDFNQGLIDQRNAQSAEAKGVIYNEATKEGKAGREGFNPVTKQWEPFIPNPEGATIGEQISTGGKGGSKTSTEEQSIKKLQEQYAAENPGKPALSYSAAKSANTLLSSKYNAGLTLTGWEHDENGNPTTPKVSAAAGSAADLRARQWDENAIFAKARAQKSGGLQAANDARATYATSALNHLDTVSKVLDEPGVDSVLGAIHGNPTYQKYRGSMFPSDVETPSEYAKIRQGLESAQAEIEKTYLGGQGAITEHERENLKAIAAGIKDAPNVATAKAMIANAKELIGGILATPTIQQVQGNPELQKARELGLQKVADQAKSMNAAAKTGAPTSITDKAAFDALPSGAEFIAPDGSHRRKP